MSLPELRPEYLAGVYSWTAAGTTEQHFYRADHPEQSADYQHSPIRTLNESGAPIRSVLENSAGEFEYPILANLAAQGFTDYAIYPMAFRRQVATLSFATKRAGGFADAELALIESFLEPVCVQLEHLSTDRMVETALNTYVGPSAGMRIIEGEIERGVAQSMEAVIWYADLRRFTEIAEQESPDMVIELINRYFEILAQAVEDGGAAAEPVAAARRAIDRLGGSQGADSTIWAGIRSKELKRRSRSIRCTPRRPRLGGEKLRESAEILAPVDFPASRDRRVGPVVAQEMA